MRNSLLAFCVVPSFTLFLCSSRYENKIDDELSAARHLGQSVRRLCCLLEYSCRLFLRAQVKDDVKGDVGAAAAKLQQQVLPPLACDVI